MAFLINRRWYPPCHFHAYLYLPLSLFSPTWSFVLLTALLHLCCCQAWCCCPYLVVCHSPAIMFRYFSVYHHRFTPKFLGQFQQVWRYYNTKWCKSVLYHAKFAATKILQSYTRLHWQFVKRSTSNAKVSSAIFQKLHRYFTIWMFLWKFVRY